ncbi:MAG: response regulator [Pseudomonadales bacterium]|nr:response regulator [Pseudomonadales bacterium]
MVYLAFIAMPAIMETIMFFQGTVSSMAERPIQSASVFIRGKLHYLAILLFLLSGFSIETVAAPIIEINADKVHLTLPDYIDVYEDKSEKQEFSVISSEEYKHRFAPSPLTDLFFGYTSSVFWLRFTIENQMDEDKNLVLDISPADIDYVDVYAVDQRTGRLIFHKESGSARDYKKREYLHPLYFFDLEVEAHSVQTIYVRLDSNKTINVQLTLNTPHEHLYYSSMRDWWQGFIFGGLIFIGVIHLALAIACSYKGFFYSGMFLLSTLFMQGSWNGYFLQFLDQSDISLLDRQLMVSIYIANIFGILFTRTYLQTHKRTPLGHKILTLMLVLSLLGIPLVWLLSSSLSSIVVSIMVMLSASVIFIQAMVTFFDGYEPAKYFLLARTATISVVLIAVFSVHGLLPQGFVTAWGVAAAIIFEGVFFAFVMSYQQFRRKQSIDKNTSRVDQESASLRQNVSLSSYCHELRTPVSGVMGMSELLLDTSLTDQQRKQVETIQRSGRALLDVVNKMSDLSSLEAGDIELLDESFDLLTLIEACVENSRAKAENKGIELIYNVDIEGNTFVRGDQNRLQLILSNLISFSIRHLDDGEVVLSIRRTDVDAVMFEVISGSNIFSQSYSPSMYESGHGTPTSSDSLNFTVARQFVELMGGKLQILYGMDGGVRASFSLHMPVQASDISPNTLENEELLVGKRLLVVDDNDTCCQIVKQQAVHWGMQVITSNSGKEAIAILRSQSSLEENFDLLLIDFDMPGMNGLQLVERIQQDEQGLNTSDSLIMMLTGVSKMPNHSAEQKQRISKILFKPLSGKSLKQSFIQVLS